jgi:hypothetical protein
MHVLDLSTNSSVSASAFSSPVPVSLHRLAILFDPKTPRFKFPCRFRKIGKNAHERPHPRTHLQVAVPAARAAIVIRYWTYYKEDPVRMADLRDGGLWPIAGSRPR